MNTRTLNRESEGRRSCISYGRASATRRTTCGGRRLPIARFAASDWWMGLVIEEGEYWIPIPEVNPPKVWKALCDEQ